MAEHDFGHEQVVNKERPPLPPKTGGKKPETSQERGAREIREKISREQERHLGAASEKGFLLGLQVRQKEQAKIREEMSGLQGVRALRNGGVTIEADGENHLEKFQRLAAAFLTPVQETNNQDGHLEFLVDFGGNDEAEWNIGAGHCLPPSVKTVRVFDGSGSELFHEASRGIKNGRVGYFDNVTGEYASIHSGYRIEVLGTGDEASDEGIKKQIAEERDFFERNEKDPTLTEKTPSTRAYWADLLGDKPEAIEPKLTRVEFLGRSFKVNQYVAPYLLEANRRLADAGVSYRAESGGGYHFRRTWGRPAETETTTEELSLHSWGVAIDINPGQNPPHSDGSTNVPPEMVSIMRDCGWAWGGNWRGDQYDPMHFQFMASPFEYTHALRSEPAKLAAQNFGLFQGTAVA